MTILQKINTFERRMDQAIKNAIDKIQSEKVEKNKPVAENVSISKYGSKNEQDDYDRILIQMNERWERMDEEKRKAEEIRPYNRFTINREDFYSDYDYEYACMSDGW